MSHPALNSNAEPAAAAEFFLSDNDGIQLGLKSPRIPAHLSGENGVYRAEGVNALGAECNNDFAVINLWLRLAYQRTKSNSTLQNYRKEIVRLARWSFRRGKPLSSLSMADATDYIQYLESPDAIDIGKKKVSITHPDWRPFLGPLSNTSIQTARNVLASFYSFCLQSLYIRINPFLNVNAVAHEGVQTIERVLSDDAVGWLFGVVDTPVAEPQMQQYKALDRWIVHCLFGLAIRAAETSTSCNAVRLKKNSEGELCWVIKITGKGAKDRELVMPDATVNAMMEYRTAYGLPPYPVPGKSNEALVMGPKGKGAISRATLHNRIKAIFKEAAAEAELANDLASVHELNQASAHWMRHTTATRLANNPNNPIHNVSAFLGHNSIATTSRYVHSDNAAQVKMMKDYSPPKKVKKQ